MKNIIKITRKVRLKNPYFIAAWPGMGNVALKTVNYLIATLSAGEFATLESMDLFYPDQAVIADGIVEVPHFPQGKFHYWKNKTGKNDLIIFSSEAQPVIDKGYFYSHKIIELAESFKVHKIITFAAMPMPIEHTQVPNVWLAATDKNQVMGMKRFNFKMMDVGQISGLNGLFLAVAKERNLSGFCLLGEIPLYTIQIDNPKASLVILESLSKILALPLKLEELKIQSRLQDEEIDRLIEYFRGGMEPNKEPIGEDEIERIKKTLQAYTRLPNSVKTKIEKMFEATSNDITKAQELKEELDKWSIYKEYEDRFLDLFKKKGQTNNQ